MYDLYIRLMYKFSYLFCIKWGLCLYCISRFLLIHYVCLFDLILYVPVNNFFSYVRTGLSGLNQYLARINVFCSRTQHSDAIEAGTHNPSILS